jgi:hypothetical protein
MNRIRRIRAVLAALAGTLLALAAASPAFARPWPPPGVPSAPVRAPAQVHTIVIGGMPGWQIALIAVGAALVAGAVAILTDRSWTARKAHATTTA